MTFRQLALLLGFLIASYSLTAKTAQEASGVVIPCRELKVRPEVGGQVIMMSPQLVLGGLVKEGDILLQIDPRDYDINIAQEEAQVAKADFECKSEQARKEIAQREWKLLNLCEECSGLGRELALREPHQREKQAALDAAQCRLDRAHFNKERTTLYAAFNGIVMEENIEIGQVLTPQSAVATIVATDCFWVSASVPLSWIEQIQGSTVDVVQQLDNGQEIVREGKVLRLLGCADPKTNLAQVLIEVNDPLGLSGDKKNPIPLLLKSQVKVRLH